MSDETPTDRDLTPERAAEMIAAGEAQLVDVRQSYEWDAGRIEGAVHIPLDQLTERATEVETARPVIFQCRSGGRSSMAQQAFTASGVDAYNLAGGLEAWVEHGLAIVPEDGTVAHPRPDNT